MTTTVFDVRGMSKLDAAMSELQEQIKSKALLDALRAGGEVFAEEIRRTVPVSPANSENARKYGSHAGSLRDSVHLIVKIDKSGKALASVRVGGYESFYAHMVEYGTRRHTIKAQNLAHPLSVGGKNFASVEHPGAAERPFVRPALDSKGDEAEAAIVASLKAALGGQS